MDAFGFVAKRPDEVIVERTGDYRTAFFDRMTVPARFRSCDSKDEIAMRVRRLIHHSALHGNEAERDECRKEDASNQHFADSHHVEHLISDWFILRRQQSHDVKRIRRLAVLKRDIGTSEEHAVESRCRVKESVFKDRCYIGVR
jgi:hypothetical protein